MAKILEFKKEVVLTTPNSVLEAAKDEYQTIILLGYDNDGLLDVRCSEELTHAMVLWLIEEFKAKLMGGCFSDN